MPVESAFDPLVVIFPHRPHLIFIEYYPSQYGSISSMAEKNLAYVALTLMGGEVKFYFASTSRFLLTAQKLWQ
jgi:hypothetical protein